MFNAGATCAVITFNAAISALERIDQHQCSHLSVRLRTIIGGSNDRIRSHAANAELERDRTISTTITNTAITRATPTITTASTGRTSTMTTTTTRT
eukprot:7297710-Karenia_brevis.AAC.1